MCWAGQGNTPEGTSPHEPRAGEQAECQMDVLFMLPKARAGFPEGARSQGPPVQTAHVKEWASEGACRISALNLGPWTSERGKREELSELSWVGRLC